MPQAVVLASLLATAVALPSSAPRADVLDLAGLVAHYPLDGTAQDTSSHHLDGTEHGTWAVPGVIGLALEFGGPASYIQIPREAFSALPQGTLAFWMNPGVSRRRPVDAGWDNQAWTLGYDILYKETRDGLTISGMKLNNDRRIQGTHNNYGRNDPELERANDITTSACLEFGQWWHVAWTWDGAVEKIYLDGKLDVSKAGHGGVAEVLGAWVRLGRGDTQYVGLLDDVWIFDRALVEAEVLQLATREPAG